MDINSFALGIFAGLLLAGILYWVISVLSIFQPWLRIFMSGGQASVFQILGMRMRGSDMKLVVDAYIMMVQRGQKVKLSEVESQYLARKHVIRSSNELVEMVERNLG